MKSCITLLAILAIPCCATAVRTEEYHARIIRVRDYTTVLMIDCRGNDEHLTRNVFWAWPDRVKLLDANGNALPFAKLKTIKMTSAAITWEDNETPDVVTIRLLNSKP